MNVSQEGICGHWCCFNMFIDFDHLLVLDSLSPETESHSEPASSSGSQWRWWNPEQRCNPHASSNFSQCNSSSGCHRSSYSCSRFPPVQVRGAFPPCPSAASHLHHRDSSKSFCSRQAILIKKEITLAYNGASVPVYRCSDATRSIFCC